MWVADFQLDRGKPSAGQIRRQIGWVFFSLFLIEVFKFSEISHRQAFSGECVGEHCIHLHVNVSPLII